MDSRNLHDRFQDSEMDARTYFLESDLALTVEERISLAELLPSVIWTHPREAENDVLRE